MAASVQSNVLDQVVALLTATGTWKAVRTKLSPWAQDQLPAFEVLPDEGEASYERAYSGVVKWTFRFKVRCIGAGTDGVDKVVDPLFVAGSKAILTDPTLGGLVTVTRYASQKWERDGEGANAPCALVVLFECEFATSQSDPSAAMP